MNNEDKRPEKMQRNQERFDLELLLNPVYADSSLYQIRTKSNLQKPIASVIIPLSKEFDIRAAEKIVRENKHLKLEWMFVDDHNHHENAISALASELGIYYTLLVGEVPQGWCAAVNAATWIASGEVVLVFDLSCQLMGNTFKRLILEAHRQDLAIPIQVNNDDELEAIGWEYSFGDSISQPKCIVKNQKMKLDNIEDKFLENIECEIIYPYCFAIRTKLLKTCPYSYKIKDQVWGAVDLSFRLREAGKKITHDVKNKVILRQRKTWQKCVDQGKKLFENDWINSNRVCGLYPDVPIKPVQTICVKRAAAHGDVLIASAVVGALKMFHPEAKIDFITNFPEVLLGHPHIDSFELKNHYDFVVNLDMAYECVPTKNILEAYADVAGVYSECCNLFIQTEKYELNLERYVVLHAGKTQWVGRNWATVKFDILAKKMKEMGFEVVVVGTISDHCPKWASVDLRGKTNCHQLAYVIEKSHLFIGIDSFPMHVAQVFNKCGLVFFGSIKPETRLIGEGLMPLVAKLDCIGCHQEQPPIAVNMTSCRRGVEECIDQCTIKEALSLISEMI